MNSARKAALKLILWVIIKLHKARHKAVVRAEQWVKCGLHSQEIINEVRLARQSLNTDAHRIQALIETTTKKDLHNGN